MSITRDELPLALCGACPRHVAPVAFRLSLRVRLCPSDSWVVSASQGLRVTRLVPW